MERHEQASAPGPFDYVVVGGGLQGALMVLALRARRPSARIALIERASRLGGNHTWCFHHGDVSAAARVWIEPLVVSRWSACEVRFPDGHRILGDPYHAILPDRLHEVVADALQEPGSALFSATVAREVSADAVALEDGRRLAARLVIDARGPGPATEDAPAGYQKFVGQILRLRAPHGLEHPVIMDARVEQSDGFRFFYLLPFAEDRLLVEETRFSSSAALDVEHARAAIAEYAEAQRWPVDGIEREEQGVLEMPWAGETEPPGTGVLRAGYRGGWFHPATGYSLPVAARLAEEVARHTPEEVRAGALRPLYREHTRQREYCHVLNRLLFRWYPPQMRWHVFARFYRLPREVIARFYALRLTATDQARLLVGRPPRGLSVLYRMRTGGAS